MIVLTDCPQRLAGIVPSGWVSRAVAELPAVDRDLWRALGAGSGLIGDVWTARVGPAAGASGFWSRLLVVAEAPVSQFDLLRERLGDGLALPGPVATLALTGRGCHGHRGRPWVATDGNLHLCVAWRPAALLARDALALTALPAVAVVDALRDPALGRLPAGIKWVNDILVGDRKLAGVLTASQALEESITLAVLGIGLNVAVTPEVPPTMFVPKVTSLAEQGIACDLSVACLALLDALARRWQGLLARGTAELFAAYRDASVVLGRSVTVWDEGLDESVPPAAWPPPLARGVVTGIGDDLTLRIAGLAEPVGRGRLALGAQPF